MDVVEPSGSNEASGLNLKQAAAELGVHYMTAYRYVRTGQLMAEKVGTGWVVAPDVLAAFLAARDAVAGVDDPATNAPGATATGGSADWVGRLERALVAGDEPAAWKILGLALASGHSPTTCYLDIIGGALHTIGSPTDESASTSYVATAVATRLVARLGGQFRRPGRSRGTVVFGAPVGEAHTLPIAIVADLFRLEGFTCIELGADVPAAVFADAAARADRLVAVGIGVTTATNIDAVHATIDAVRRAVPDAPVLLGGQAVRNADIAALAGATHWAADGTEALAVISALARPSRRPGIPKSATVTTPA